MDYVDSQQLSGLHYSTVQYLYSFWGDKKKENHLVN